MTSYINVEWINSIVSYSDWLAIFPFLMATSTCVEQSDHIAAIFSNHCEDLLSGNPPFFHWLLQKCTNQLCSVRVNHLLQVQEFVLSLVVLRVEVTGPDSQEGCCEPFFSPNIKLCSYSMCCGQVLFELYFLFFCQFCQSSLKFYVFLALELFVHFCHHGDDLLIFDNSWWESWAAYPLHYRLLFGTLFWRKPEHELACPSSWAGLASLMLNLESSKAMPLGTDAASGKFC